MSYSHTSWSTKEEGGQGQYADAPEAVGFPQAPHFRRVPERGMVRQASSSPTSSLSGAMGDAHITNSHLGGSVPSGMAWSIPQGAYGQLADDSSMSAFGPAPPTPASAGPSGQFSLYSYQTPYNTPSYSPNPDPYPHHSSALPSPTSFAEQFAMQQARADVMAHAHQGLSTPGPATPTSAGAMAGSMSMAPSPIPGAVPMGRDPRRSSSEEIRRLHQRIAELEADRDTVVQRAHQLEQELARRMGGLASSFASGSALPSPMPTPTHPSALEEEWRARTEARRKIFCGVNRAGNALCAWHDSRRERRAYPPRNAPPGMLNCGCTYEQALFEESLSYHGVGSYHPGESVRMDPALRNPLLKLLEERYNYRDGDFDFDPVTRTWRNGEGAAYWEQRLASGAANTRRARGDDRR